MDRRAESVGLLLSSGHDVAIGINRIPSSSLRLLLLLIVLLKILCFGRRNADGLQVIDALRIQFLQEWLVKSLSHGLELLAHIVAIQRIHSVVLSLVIARLRHAWLRHLIGLRVDRDVIVDVRSLFNHGPRTLQLLIELLFTLLQLSLVVDIDQIGAHRL